MEEKSQVQKTNKMLQKSMISTVILGALVPFTLFLLFLYLDWFQVLKFDISSRFNYWSMVFFICLSFILFLSFIHITVPIKNLKKCNRERKNVNLDNDNKDNKDCEDSKEKSNFKSVYLKIGWITLKTSHHKPGNINHELKIGEHNICCGCYGGALGLIIGEIIGSLYLFYYNEPSKIIGLISFFLGIILILISFAKYIWEVYDWKRLLLNSCLALGTWLIIIGINIYFLNFYSVLYYFIVVPFIGIQRLTLSSLDHQVNKENKEESSQA
ncbi:hypothetical protein DSAG12_02691 [Promethearchaeum syntrophicum]|uniref:Uncharacterized protein n=1 Tax=Promethearchaeum syntrophicum TaxID=2594042 RepID=A0A5B9DCT8_9ARCH|nr:hypothetical protein [Candidatus Prometheoarchaeum syntrophicum]QEE16861.1 hypothetical protein DSAG12_02691 [Candidatus Prometheoarchaeum syntrophicum]